MEGIEDGKSWSRKYLMTAAAAVVALAFVRLLLRVRRSEEKLRLPPGPKGYPLLGNFLVLRKSPANTPHQALHRIAKEYGPLIYLRFGAVPAVVASSVELAKEILKTSDAIFASRLTTIQGEHLFYDHQDLISSPMEENTRFLRKICAVVLFSHKRVEQFKHIREEEVLSWIGWILKDGRGGGLVDLTKRMSELTLNNTTRLLFGKRFFGNTNVDASRSQKFLEFIEEFFLQGGENKSNGLALTDERNNGLLWDLLLWGTDTSSHIVVWIVAVLLKHPEIMKKSRAEVESVVGKERMVEETDIANLPYLQAVVKETLRLYPVSLITIPRKPVRAIKLAGYDIPENCLVMVNTFSIQRDPNLWPDPLKFDPDRFLNGTVDHKGFHFQFLPFGSGRRMCPGMALGMIMVALTLAQLLRACEFSLPGGMKPEDVDLTEELRSVVALANPPKLLVRPRFGGRHRALGEYQPDQTTNGWLDMRKGFSQCETSNGALQISFSA